MRSTTVDVGGPLRLLEGGDRGPALALVHGLDLSADLWLEVAGPLVADHRVTACDLPGFGRSPLARRRPTLTAQADLLAELVRTRLGGAATLVGSSTGAVVCLLAAARHPQVTSGVVLLTPALPRLDTGGLDPGFVPLLTVARIPGMLMLEPWRRSLQPPEQRVGQLLEVCYAEGSERPSPATLEALVATAASRRRGDHLRAWAGTTRSLFWWLARPERFHGLGDTTHAPVTLVEGVEDPVLPRATVRTTLARHPSWRHVPLAGVGHLPPLERPEAVADTIRSSTGPSA